MAAIMTTDYLGTQVTSLDADLPNITRAFYNRQLLERARPLLLHDRFGLMRPLKRRNGQTMVFRRWETLAAATTPLTESVTPAGSSLNKTDYTATINFYGDYVVISDKVKLTHIDDVTSEAVDILGEQMGDTGDIVTRDVLVAGTSVFRVTADGASPAFGTGARNTVNGIINKTALDEALVTLQVEKGRTMTPKVPPGLKTNTWPISEAYWCLIHPHVANDLYKSQAGFGTKEFVPVEEYASGTGVIKGEVGKYRGIRFVMTTNAKVWTDVGAGTVANYRSTTGSAVDVYACLLFAARAYGVIPLEGASRVLRQSAGGPSDPLEQRNTVGWKMAKTACILNQAWMTRIEVASRNNDGA